MTVVTLIIVITLAAAATRIAWVRPQNGLLLLAALAPFNGALAVLPSGAVPAWWKEALVGVTLVAAVAAAVRNRSRTARPAFTAPWLPALAASAVFGTGSALIVFGPPGLLAVKITYFYLLIIMIARLCPFTATDRDRLITVIMAVGTVNAAVGVIQQFVGAEALVDLGYEYGAQVRTAGALLRSFGTFNQPFPYAFFLMMTILIGLAAALGDPHRRRNRAFLWLLPLLIVGMALSVVRASYIGLAVGLLVLGAVRYRGVLVGLAAAIVVGVPLLAVAAPSSLLTSVTSSDSLATRVDGWDTTWRAIVDHPLGNGLGSSGSAADKLTAGAVSLPDSLRSQIDGSLAYAFGLPYQPDNYYVKMLLELGPLGLWLFVLVLAGLFVDAVRVARTAGAAADRSFAAGAAGFFAAGAVAAYFSTYLEIFPVDVFTWLTAAALACIPRAVRRRPVVLDDWPHARLARS